MSLVLCWFWGLYFSTRQSKFSLLSALVSRCCLERASTLPVCLICLFSVTPRRWVMVLWDSPSLVYSVKSWGSFFSSLVRSILGARAWLMAFKSLESCEVVIF